MWMGQCAHLLVDLVSRLLGEVAAAAGGLSEERGAGAAAPRDLPERLAEAHLLHHHARGARHLLEVAPGAGGDVILPEDELLRNAAPQRDGHLVL